MARKPKICYDCKIRPVSSDKSVASLDLCDPCEFVAGTENSHSDRNHAGLPLLDPERADCCVCDPALDPRPEVAAAIVAGTDMPSPVGEPEWPTDTETFEVNVLLSVDVLGYAKYWDLSDVEARQRVLDRVAQMITHELTTGVGFEAHTTIPDGGVKVSTPVACRYFAGCDRQSTTLIAHPVLGGVPSCERCAKLAGRPAVRALREARASAS